MSDPPKTQQAQPPNPSSKQQEQPRTAAQTGLLTWKDPNSQDRYVLNVPTSSWFLCIDNPQPPDKPFQQLPGQPPAYLAQVAASRAYQAMGAQLGQIPAPAVRGADLSKQQPATQAETSGTAQTLGMHLARPTALAAGATDSSKQQSPKLRRNVIDTDSYDLATVERIRKRDERRDNTQCPTLGNVADPSTPTQKESKRPEGQPKRRGRPPGILNRKRERTPSSPAVENVKKSRSAMSEKTARPSRAKPQSKPETAPETASKAPAEAQPERRPWFSIHQQHVLDSAHPHLPSKMWNTNHWDWHQANRFISIGLERDFAALSDRPNPANPRIDKYRHMGLTPSDTVVPGEYFVEKDRTDAHFDDWWQDGKLPEENLSRWEWPKEETTLFADAFDADSYPEGFDMNVAQPDPAEIFRPAGPAGVSFSGPAERAAKRVKAERERIDANEALLGPLEKYQIPEDDFIDFAEPREEIPRNTSVDRRVKRMEAERKRYRAPKASVGTLAQAELSSSNDRPDCSEQTSVAHQPKVVTRSGSAEKSKGPVEAKRKHNEARSALRGALAQ